MRIAIFIDFLWFSYDFVYRPNRIIIIIIIITTTKKTASLAECLACLTTNYEVSGSILYISTIFKSISTETGPGFARIIG